MNSLAVPPATLTLAWDPSSDPTVAGYRLYQGMASQNFTNVFEVGSNLQTTVYGLLPGATYYFAVTAYDNMGLESALSGEISYTAPMSPSGPPSMPATVFITLNDLGQAVVSGSGPAGYVFEVWATTDFSAWSMIGSIAANIYGEFQFTDLESDAIPMRYYRLRPSRTPFSPAPSRP